MWPNRSDELETLFVAGDCQRALHHVVRVLVEYELSDSSLLGKLFHEFRLRVIVIKAQMQDKRDTVCAGTNNRLKHYNKNNQKQNVCERFNVFSRR